MSAARGRAGLLSCSCDFDAPDEARLAAGPAPLALVAAGFSFSVLAQALAFAALPIAGAVLAPTGRLATLPVVVMLAGAAASTFPASFLTGLFGRRSAFALGASLGAAGAAVGAWAVAQGQFEILCLAAFWLGAAQGFGLFYRHSVGRNPRAIAFVLGSASLAAFAAPAVVRIAQAFAGPLAPAGALLGAGLAQLCVLALSAPLPASAELSGEAPGRPISPAGFAIVTAVAAVAWFGMMALMAGAPLAMAGCGLGLGAASSAIAWHVLAMYAPAALIGAAGLRLQPALTAFAGLLLLALACLAARLQSTAAGFDLALIAGGCGWSLATLGATQWMHAAGAPSRLQLGLHDFALFATAALGAWAASTVI